MKIYQVDAFTSRLFGGNPAAVVPLTEWLPDAIMQKIAAENNLAETAFIVPQGDGFGLRWFTPKIEVKLCGHATLATAHILFSELDYAKESIYFHTQRSGILHVKKLAEGYEMDFPADKIVQQKVIPKGLSEGLGIEVKELWKGDTDYLVVADNQSVIEKLQPNFHLLGKHKVRGVIVTARGEERDFVSRCFYPQAGIDEDPTTGSAHTSMTPYWANKLEKHTLTATQISERVGELECVLQGDRVLLRGQAVTYLKGEISIEENK